MVFVESIEEVEIESIKSKFRIIAFPIYDVDNNVIEIVERFEEIN